MKKSHQFQLFKADLLTFWFCLSGFTFSNGPKRLTFYNQVLWATEQDSADGSAYWLWDPVSTMKI